MRNWVTDDSFLTDLVVHDSMGWWICWRGMRRGCSSRAWVGVVRSPHHPATGVGRASSGSGGGSCGRGCHGSGPVINSIAFQLLRSRISLKCVGFFYKQTLRFKSVVLDSVLSLHAVWQHHTWRYHCFSVCRSNTRIQGPLSQAFFSRVFGHHQQIDLADSWV